MGTTETIIRQCHRVKQGYTFHLGGRKIAGPGEVLDNIAPDLLEGQKWKVDPIIVLEKGEPMPPPLPQKHPDYIKDASWQGRRCFILGGGPSLANFDVSRLKGELTIGVNRAFELIDPTIICSVDSRFYGWALSNELGQGATQKFLESLAWKIWLDTHNYKFDSSVQTAQLVENFKGLSLQSGMGKTSNSGLFALKIALALGASPIYLLGFDMHPNGRRQEWWHDGYKYVQKDAVYETFLAEFAAFLPQVEESGARVINVNQDSALRCFEFGELPQDLNRGPLYVSYYTPGLYAEKAKKLRLSLHRMGLDYHIEEVEDRGSWDANTKIKAEFILQMLESHPGRNIIFVDADAVVRQYPVLFDTFSGDVGVHFFRGRELLSGTLFLKNTPRVHSLVRAWIKENVKFLQEWEQKTLQRILQNRVGRWRVEVKDLPPSYCQIFDIMASCDDPVIEHFQASRAYKRGKASRQRASTRCEESPPLAINSVTAAPGNIADQVTVITPTGDRPEAIALLRRWMAAQTKRPDQWLIIDDGKTPLPPIHEAQVVRREPRIDDPVCTLAPNLEAAFPLIKHDKILIMEDDDWYSSDYIKTMTALLDQHDLVGIWGTKYYHVDVPGFRQMGKDSHASLSQTGFRRHFIPQVLQSLPGDCSIDLRLWREHSNGHGHLIRGAETRLHCSMKGLPGRPGAGVGHDKNRFTADPTYQMLKQWCGDWEAYQQPFKVKNRLVVYTAIAGNHRRDQLADPAPIPGVDYVCFTDQGFKSEVWEIRPFAWSHQDAVRTAKHPKILPHEYFPDHDLSIWVDGNIIPNPNMAESVRKLLAEHNIAIHRHPRRSCLYREAETIIAHHKDDPVVVEKVVFKYLTREKIPHGAGLYEGGIIYRRHHDPEIKRAMDLWWQEIEAGSCRDQLSLPYVIIKTGLKLKVIDCNLRVSPDATFRQHEDLRWKNERG